MIHSNFPVNAVYQWSRGPEEVLLYVDLNDDLKISDNELKERLRERLGREMEDVRFSFEPSDIINEVMSFGSPTPVEVAVSGSNFADHRMHAEKVRRELEQIPSLRDLQVGQSLDYPTVEVNVDRERLTSVCRSGSCTHREKLKRLDSRTPSTRWLRKLPKSPERRPSCPSDGRCPNWKRRPMAAAGALSTRAQRKRSLGLVQPTPNG